MSDIFANLLYLLVFAFSSLIGVVCSKMWTSLKREKFEKEALLVLTKATLSAGASGAASFYADFKKGSASLDSFKNVNEGGWRFACTLGKDKKIHLTISEEN